MSRSAAAGASSDSPGIGHEVERFRLHVADGIASDAVLARAGDPGAPAVLVVPALGVPARAYLRLVDALRADGLHAMVFDLRGVGTSSVRAARDRDWGYHDLAEGELAAALAALDSRLPRRGPLLLAGHSLGGQLIALHLARRPETDAAVVLVGSGTPYWRAYPWWMRPGLLLFAGVVAASSRLLGVFRGDLIGFGSRQGATLMQQWARFISGGRLPGGDGFDPDAALARRHWPLLALQLPRDRYVPPGSAHDLARRFDPSAEPRRLSPDGGVPEGHFGWLKQPQAIAARIAAYARGL